MNVSDYIKLEALGLPVGVSISTTCPVCKGGTNKKRSLSITRAEAGILYHCFRATCSGCSGFIQIDRGNYHEEHISTRSRMGKPQNEHIYAPGAREINYLSRRFGLTSTECYNLLSGISRDGNYCFAIYDANGGSRGIVDRNYTGRTPKAIINLLEAQCKLHYDASAQGSRKEVVVLVEDVISAKKVGRYLPCCALLGCSLTEEAAEELAATTSSIIIALDPDAMKKALVLKRKYAMLFKSITIKYLPRDPKDMTDEQLEKYFNV